MISRTDVADHLDRAADLILTKGLARGTWKDPQGAVCTGEALIETSPNNQTIVRNAEGLASACPAAVWVLGYWLLMKHNDRPLRDVYQLAGYIIGINDRRGALTDAIDMEQEMRLCAKELREREGRCAA